MAALKPRSSGSWCFQFLRNTLLHKPYLATYPLRSLLISQSLCRDSPSSSRVTEPDVRLGMVHQDLITARTTWRPANVRWMRCVHTAPEEIKAPRDKKGTSIEKLTLYRAKWIRPIRLLVRLKLIQLGGIMALAIPLAKYDQGSLSLATTLAVGAIVGGSGAASTALWYYSRRLIGEMALLLPDLRIMQISVLDFWGNREDLQFDVRDILPPLKGMTKEELERAAQQIVIPLNGILSSLVAFHRKDSDVLHYLLHLET